jgi:predicted flap endonuclease-1-like 5' DNA nuclease
MLDNPWLYAFLLQREVNELDPLPATGGTSSILVNEISKKEVQDALNVRLLDAIPNLGNSDYQVGIKERLEMAIEKLSLQKDFQAELKSAIAEAITKFGEENITKQLEDISIKYFKTEQELNALQIEIGLLKEEKNTSKTRIEELEAERKKLDSDLHAALEKLATHEHEPPEGPTSETAWKYFTEDLNRPKVTVSIKDGKVVLAGLQLPKLPDSQDFKKEYLSYVRRYFETAARKPGNPETKDEPATVAVKSTMPGNRQEEKAIPKKLVKSMTDDLTQLVGIGKIIRDLLHQHGIATFHQLSTTTEQEIETILAATGVSLGPTNPSNWIVQASLLAAGKLEEWQDWKKKQQK